MILCSNVYLLSLHFLIEFHISLCNKILFFGKLNKTFSIVTIASVLCVRVFALELLLSIKFCVNSCYCLWVNWLLPFQKTTFFCIFQKKRVVFWEFCCNFAVTLHYMDLRFLPSFVFIIAIDNLLLRIKNFVFKFVTIASQLWSLDVALVLIIYL